MKSGRGGDEGGLAAGWMHVPAQKSAKPPWAAGLFHEEALFEVTRGKTEGGTSNFSALGCLTLVQTLLVAPLFQVTCVTPDPCDSQIQGDSGRGERDGEGERTRHEIMMSAVTLLGPSVAHRQQRVMCVHACA